MFVLLSAIAPFARADDQQRSQQSIPIVVVTGQKESADSAIAQSPTMTPLDVTEPTVDISQDFIKNNMPLTSNFSEIIGLSPSVQSVSPNGPGLMENQILSIRGFVDGYYNVTFDGIPFQDSNDFTHHSTSYFMSHDLGGVNVNYGPGTAATIGNATFCCSVDNLSKAPLARPDAHALRELRQLALAAVRSRVRYRQDRQIRRRGGLYRRRELLDRRRADQHGSAAQERFGEVRAPAWRRTRC